MKQLKLGITGCIGSGKSVFSSILRTIGIPIYDCDKNAKILMQNNTIIRQEIIDAFGEECYSVKEGLNRKHLANIIFNNPTELQKINNIVHPHVKNDFKSWCTKQNTKIVGIESAILFEANFRDATDYVIAIYADMEICISRACKRSNSTRDEIVNRMKQQMSINEIIKKSDFCIYNNEDTALLPQINKLLNSLKNTSIEKNKIF